MSESSGAVVNTPTPFPTLRSQRSDTLDTSQPTSTSQTPAYSGFLLPSQLILLSWAQLLRAYSAHDLVRFYTDSGSVSVAPGSLNVVQELDSFTDAPYSISTGVSFDPPVTHQPWSLWLHHHLERGVGVLVSNCPVPTSHLLQLGRQLQSILIDFAEEQSKDYTLPSVQDVQLSTLNPSPVLHPCPERLHHILDPHSSSLQTALVHLDRDGQLKEYSYATLVRKARALAARLRKAILRLDSSSKQLIIPIFAPQSPELYIGELAILYAGAAFCPLALDAPQERIKFICQDTCALLLLTTEPLTSKLPALQPELFVIDQGEESPEDDIEALCTPCAQATLSYVMYTSGSTGQPKGVEISHSAVLQSLKAHEKHIPSFRRFLQFAAPTFDVSIFEIFFTLMRGATIVSCDRTTLLESLSSIINRLEVDAVELTPTVAATLLRSRDACPNLRLVLTIGEMLARPVIDEFGTSDIHVGILHAMYGPTEAAVHCTLQPALSSSSIIGNIGRPLDTVSAFIVDCDSSKIRLLPVGYAGELAIGGHQLADGYINRPEQTNAAFSHSEQFGRIYRTGDRARLLPDGTLECLGRVSDGQVKIRGQRIELGEIEQVAVHHSAIEYAVASIIDEQIVLFAVPKLKSLSLEDVRQTCQTWLPPIMVPAHVHLLEKFPRLPSAKVDRKRLESIHQAQEKTGDGDSARPSNKVEQQISDALQRILGRRLGQTDAFTRGGLDSLDAIRLASTLSGDRHRIGASTVLSAGSIQELARIVGSIEHGQSRGTAAKQKISDLKSFIQEVVQNISFMKDVLDDIEDVVPCSPTQLAMLAETNANSKAYCNSIEFDLHADAGEVQRVMHEVSQANDILRSGFVQVPNKDCPYAAVVWKRLPTEQLCVVDQIDTEFVMGAQQDFLRPLRIQIQNLQFKCRVRFHIHHALYDGWSWDLLVNDVQLALRHKQIPERPGYDAYTAAVFEYLHSSEMQSSLSFWKRALSEVQANPLPQLTPYQRRSRPVQKLSYQSMINLNHLRSVSREHDVHAQAFYLAALSMLLRSYTACDEVVVGTVSAGRTLPIAQIENIVGPCMATLPLRTKFGTEKSALDLVCAIQRQTREMLEHGNVPLSMIKSYAGLEPSSVLFDTLVVWQEMPKFTGEFASKPISRLSSIDFVEQKILLELEPSDSSLRLTATYKSDMVSASQMEVLLRQLDNVCKSLLIRGATPSSHQILCDLPQDCLSIHNATPVKQELKPLNYHVQAWAKCAPDQPALEFVDQEADGTSRSIKLSYQDLNTRANKLASCLLRNGVRAGEVVCLLMDKCLDLYVAELAIANTGAAFLPISPSMPKDRVRDILSISNTRICVVRNETDLIVDAGKPITFLDVESPQVAKAHADDIQGSFAPDDLAYVIFTSGTTGLPKGVAVTQENITSNLEALASIYPKPLPGSRFLQSCSHAFDVSVFDIFYSWSQGMCLVSAPTRILYRDIELFIQEQAITHLSMTPTVAAMIDPSNVPKVQMLVTAGEMMTDNVLRKWAGSKLYNGCGPAETTNICSVGNCPKSDMRVSLVGQPLPTTSAFVIDPNADFTILPRGVVGELCFGGTQVFKQYLNQEDLTRAKIVNHPRYGRLYRSGDVGTMLADGSLVCSGRVDNQVKIRGQRVELDDIDSIIMQLPVVRQCTTIAVTNGEARGEYLATFWVASTTKPETNAEAIELDEQVQASNPEIFELVLQKLPEYMCPRIAIPVTRLPKTPNDKLDRKTLESYAANLSPRHISIFSREAQDENAQGSVVLESEAAIRRILSELTGLPSGNIIRTRSFYSYGIDSITAIAFAARLRGQFHKDQIDVSTILSHPSAVSLARHLEQEGGGCKDGRKKSVSIDDVISDDIRARANAHFQGVHDILPCTPLQESMLSAFDPAQPEMYYNTTVFKVNIKRDELKGAWQRVMERQDILRTRFMSTMLKDVPFVQVVLTNSVLPWNDRMSADLNAHKAIERLVDSHEPPWRLTLARSAPLDADKLALHMHHALYDGIAIDNLLYEVERICKGDILDAPVPFRPFLERMLNSNTGASDSYWVNHVAGYEPVKFPDLTGKSKKDRQNLTGYRTTRHNISIPLSSITASCQRCSTTLLAVCQSAWVKLLQAYVGSTDVCFGNVMSCRNMSIDGLERLIAPCFNTLPIRLRVEPTDTNIDLQKQLVDINSGHLQHQLTPLRQIQAHTTLEGQHLFDTLFILQQPSRPTDSSILSVLEDSGNMDFPLAIELTPNSNDDTLAISLHFERSRVPDDCTHIIASTFQQALHTCLQEPQSAAMSFCSSRLFVHRSMSKYPYHLAHQYGHELLHSAFERNAREQPLASALEFLPTEGVLDIWSFKRVNSKANAIARSLQDVGVKQDDAVIIHLAKTPLFYASMLGILKAGAAFTPFDPDVPEDRKIFMETELDARVILVAHDTAASWSRCRSIDVRQVPENASGNVYTSVGPTDLAYRLYTSGSTGHPKAVSIEHRNAVQTLSESRSRLPWTHSSRLLQYASVTFDMCYYDCFMAWSYGFTLCVAPQSAMYNDLAGISNSLQVSILDLTPSVAALIQPAQVPNVELLYCIGETLDQHLVDLWGHKLLNSYGPTEAAMCVTIFPVDENASSAIIGSPFPSTTFVIVGEGGYVLPTLGVGELYIGGAQVARGYHANEELTRKQFVDWEGQRFYRSGDRVRMLANGVFEFIGRIDDQIKIRGLRVELDEINAVARNSDTLIVGVTTQLLKPSVSGKPQLYLFVTLSEADYDTTAVKDRIMRACKAKLPPYMVPALVVLLDRIPLSPAGKADKRKLLAILQDQLRDFNLADGETVTFSRQERIVVEALSSLAGVEADQIRPHTSIFHLGLDSISAVQIAQQLTKRRLTIEPSNVMRNPTATGIAAACHAQEADTAVRETTPPASFDFRSFENQLLHHVCVSNKIGRTAIARIRPCTPFQAGLVAQSLHSRGASYLNYMCFKFKMQSAHRTLENALDVLFEKHEMLRTGFVSLENRDHPFGMVTYRSRSAKLPLALDEVNQVEQWLEQATETCLSRLHLPAWRALIQDDGDGLNLHIVMHHALYDATSLQMLLDDLNIILQGFMPEPAGNNIEPTISHILSKAKAEDEAQSFWRLQQGHTGVNRFPNLSPLKSESRMQLAIETVSSKSISELEDDCKRLGITIAIVGQAAWARLLSAYTGEDAVVFGNVLSGRTTQEARITPFPCLTTVPIIADCSQDDAGLLSSLAQFNISVSEHQFIPLNKVQRWLGLGEEALFDTLFAYQKQSSDQSKRVFDLADWRAAVEYPLSIELEPSVNGRLTYRLTFPENKLPRAQAKTLLRQLDSLIISILSPTSQPLQLNTSDLLSITPPKHPRIDSDASFLHELFEISAARTPQKVAFEFVTNISEGRITRRTWSYHELAQEGNKVANFLIRRGIEQGSLVALCFNKCPEASFTMLGILKAGCGFVAIDSDAPRARKSFIVQDSRAAALVTTSDLGGSFGEDLICPVYAIDAADLSESSANTPILSRSIRTSDTSYCLYTSGTTGIPKGCELSHDNAVQAMMAFCRLFKWRDDGRWLQFAGYHFDVSVLEHFWTWGVGLCLVGITRDALFEDLGRNIGRLRITHVDLTPALAQTVDPEDVPGLCTDHSVFITGGEALRDDIISKWGCFETIYNGYGPTEATIGCTMYPRVPSNGKSSNIGPQFDNVGSLVLKPGTRDPVLRGSLGELCVYGPLVAKGYLDRPEKTGQCFQDIEVNGHTERMYRTGDLVRILHDGSFAFVGRADDQIKLRGQRIETREINSVIQASSSSVRDVVTLKIKHPKQQKEQLVSFLHVQQHSKENALTQVVVAGTRDVVDASLRACQDRLPKFAVPTHLIPMTSFPLSGNNKVDTKQLKVIFDDLAVDELQRLRSAAQDNDGSPLTGGEMDIARILCTYSDQDISTVRKSTTIFEAGLDSVSILGFARALRDAGFTHAQPGLLMKHASLAKLSKALSATADAVEVDSVQAAVQNITAFDHQCRGQAAKALEVNKSDIERVAPCTPLQQGMISRALSSNKPMYFASFRLTLKPSTNLDQLHRAWESVVRKVQVLRTRFVATDQGHLQAVIREPPSVWREMKWQQHDEPLLGGQFEDWVTQNQDEITQPVEIVVYPATNKIILALHIFHALYDGNSLPLLLDAVTREYHGYTVDSGPAFQEVLPHGPLLQMPEARGFWLNHLERAGRCKRIASSTPLSTTEDHFLSISIPVPPKFEECRRKLKTTDQALVQASWVATLCDFFGPVILGIVVSGRQIGYEDVEKTIGPLFNTIPLVLPLSGSMDWSSAVSQCHAYNVAALQYQHTPLRDIIKWAVNKGIVSTPSLFDILFVFQKARKHPSQVAPIWETVDSGSSVADYPLAIEVEHRSDGTLDVSISAQAAVTDEVALHRLLDGFERALCAMTANPQAKISDTFLLSEVDETAMTGGRLSSHSPTNEENGHATTSSGFTWNQTAQEIRDKVSHISGVRAEDINGRSSILELGLDSVDAIKLSSSLKREAGIRLSQRQIMQSLTIAKMAEATSGHNSTEDKQGPPTTDLTVWISRLKEDWKRQSQHLKDIERVLPLTPLQEAMLSQMYASDFKIYLNHDILKLRPNIDIEKLKHTWQVVVDSNPILRTSFVHLDNPNSNGSFAQLVHRPRSIEWREEDSEGENEHFAAIQDEVRNAVKEADGSVPPIRFTFIRNPETGYVTHLILSIAHALYDGWTMEIIHHDIQRTYVGQCIQRPSYEPILAEIMHAAEDGAARDYWHDALTGLAPTLISHRFPETQPYVHRSERTSRQPATALARFCKAKGVSISALAQSAFALTLATLVKKTDLAFGVVLSGRDTEESQQTVFPTMNTIASRTVLHGSRADMARYVQETMNQVRSFEKYPLRKALSKAQRDRGVSRFFDALFLFQRRPATLASDANVELYESVSSASSVEYPLAVEAEVVGDALIWRNACQGHVFTQHESVQLLDTLDRILQSIVDEPEAPSVTFHDLTVSVCGLRTFTQHVSSPEPEAPRSSKGADSKLLAAMRSIVAEVAQVDDAEIRPDTTLFGLGLDSISAIRVQSLLRKRNLRLSVREMLNATTIDNMASIVQRVKSGEEENHGNMVLSLGEARNANRTMLSGLDIDGLLEPLGLRHEDIETAIPAAAGQTYMLVTHAKSGVFHPTFEYTLKRTNHQSEIEMLDRLTQSWNKLVASTPVLRTLFLTTNTLDTPLMQILATPHGIAKYSANHTLQAESGTDTYKRIGIQTPFVGLFASATSCDAKIHLKLHIHHALYDGVSLPLLIDRLQRLMHNPSAIIAPSSDEQIGAMTVLSAASHPESAIAERHQFWFEYMRGMTTSATSLARADVARHAPEHTRVEAYKPYVLGSDHVTGIRQLAKEHNVAVQAIFLASYARIYARIICTPEDHDIILGVYLANRDLPLADANVLELPIPTLNLLPLRVRHPRKESTSVADIAKQIQGDIRRISEDAARATTSLAQIYEITEGRVTVDTFVNFLSLPSADRTDAQDSDGGFVIEDADTRARDGEYARVVDAPAPPGPDDATAMQGLDGAVVAEAYRPALDVEAAITKRGELAMGVFCDEAVLGLEDAEALMDRVRVEMVGLVAG